MRVHRARGTLALLIVLVSVLLVAGTLSKTPNALGAPAPLTTPKEDPPGNGRTPSPTPTPAPTPTPTTEPSPAPSPSPSPSSGGGATNLDPSSEGQEVVGSRATSRVKGPEALPAIWWDLGPSYSGGYSSTTLTEMAQHLAQLGASKRAVRNVYAPFIVAGPAEFSDTWGSVRHNDGDSLRPHLGQDVFCESGAEVLAAEPGRVEFTTDRLGGLVVRLHRADGGYWYYAHLLDYATKLSSGDFVETGDVIGYCGASGNAAGASPHVHFGSYPGPVNPMGDLIGWLQEAEDEARRALKRRKAESVGLGTELWVYNKNLVEPCVRFTVAEEPDPLDLILSASN